MAKKPLKKTEFLYGWKGDLYSHSKDGWLAGAELDAEIATIRAQPVTIIIMHRIERGKVVETIKL